MKKNFRYVNRLSSVLTIILATFLLMQFYACKNKNSDADSSMKNMKMDKGDSNMKGMDMETDSLQGTNTTNDPSMQGLKMSDGMSNMPKESGGGKITQRSLSVNTTNLKVNDLLQPSNQIVIARIGTVTPIRKTMDEPVIANGTIDYDQRRFSNVASRFNGRIEKLYVKYNLQKVWKGQKLFDIYSPELVNAQQDYIFLLNDTSSNTLVIRAETKLKLLGLDPSQIAAIRSTKKAIYAVTVYSNASGYVVWEEGQKKNISVEPQSSNSAMSAMGKKNMEVTAPNMLGTGSSEFLKEGQYVSKGETVFRIVNTDVMWALVNVFREDLSRISLGNKVTIISENSETTIDGKVDFIQPYFKSGDKTATLRVYVNNSNTQIRTGNLFKAKIYGPPITGTWIPRQSVLDVGNTKVVFLKVGNVFRATQIKTGAILNNWIAVVSGLHLDAEIAANAQYLIDSEAFIKTE